MAGSVWLENKREREFKKKDGLESVIREKSGIYSITGSDGRGLHGNNRCAKIVQMRKKENAFLRRMHQYTAHC